MFIPSNQLIPIPTMHHTILTDPKLEVVEIELAKCHEAGCCGTMLQRSLGGYHYRLDQLNGAYPGLTYHPGSRDFMYSIAVIKCRTDGSYHAFPSPPLYHETQGITTSCIK